MTLLTFGGKAEPEDVLCERYDLYLKSEEIKDIDKIKAIKLLGKHEYYKGLYKDKIYEYNNSAGVIN